MEPIEVRDLDAARRFILEGLWLQRAVKPTAKTVKAALEWSMEIASGGHPLPPVGFVADVGHIALGVDAEQRLQGAGAGHRLAPGARPQLRGPRPRQAVRGLDVRAGRRRAPEVQGRRPEARAGVHRQPDPRAGRHPRRAPPAGRRSAALQTTPADDVLRDGLDGLARDGPSAALGADVRGARLRRPPDGRGAGPGRHPRAGTGDRAGGHGAVRRPPADPPDDRPAGGAAPGPPGEAPRRAEGGAHPRPRRGPVPRRRVHVHLHERLDREPVALAARVHGARKARTCST